MAKKQVVEEEATEPMSAKEAAIALNTDARTFRKFMRDILDAEDQPGQGNRYAIDPDELDDLRKQFKSWSQPKQKRQKRQAKDADVGIEVRHLPDDDSDPDEIYELTDDDVASILTEDVDEDTIEELMQDDDEMFDILDD
jgi:hypothetical protein